VQSPGGVVGEVTVGEWVLGSVVGVVVAVGFDALLHGLSHGSHGLLDQMWHSERSERVSPTVGLGAIGWHVIVDVVIGIALATLIALAAPVGLGVAVAIGALAGLCLLAVWGHAYASLEVRFATVLVLGGLALLQAILVGLAVGLTYQI